MAKIHLLTSPEGISYIGKELKSGHSADVLDREYNMLQKIYSSAREVPDNIVKVYGLANVRFPSGNKRMLVMEKIDGPDGSAMLMSEYMNRKSGHDKINFIKYTIFSLLKAERHAMNAGVVHNDLKPLNFMYDAYGTLKVIDWGVSGESGMKAPRGTRGFIAPEALNKHKETIDVKRIIDVPTQVYETVQRRIRGRLQTVCRPTTVLRRMVMVSSERRLIDASADEKSDLYSIGVVLGCCMDMLGVSTALGESLRRRMTEKDRGNRIGLDDALNHSFLRTFSESRARDLIRNMPGH